MSAKGYILTRKMIPVISDIHVVGVVSLVYGKNKQTGNLIRCNYGHPNKLATN